MTTLRQGLIGEYLFDGNAEDSSGHGYHARAVGVTLTENRFGQSNQAYAFSGNGDHIVLDPPPKLNSEVFSLSVWVKYHHDASMAWWNNAIVSQDHGRESDPSRRVFQLSTKGQFFTWHRWKLESDVIGKQPIQRGVWYHIVAVFDGAFHKLYVNGELVDEKSGSFKPNAEEPIFIGKKNSDEKRFWFHGAVDDIRLYDRAIGPQEISELYREHGYTGDPGVMSAVPSAARRTKNTAKKRANNCPVQKTLEIQRFNWNDCYNSFALALHGAMRYSNRPISLPQALVYTGQAFVINTDTTVGPMDVYGDGNFVRAALNNLGFDVEMLAANMYGSEWQEDSIDKALALVRESIHRGYAIVGWNLDNYEHGLIYGYDDKRRILNIHDINARDGGELSYDDFGRRPLNGEPIAPELFVLALRERDGAQFPHLSVTRYSVEDDISYRKSLRVALDLAVHHIAGEEPTVGGRKNGISAIDAWISAFESGTAHRFFTSYNLLWITSTRQYLAPFFMQSAITHCTAIQNVPLQRLMVKAAEVYLASYQAWVGLREVFPFPHGADTTEPTIKATALRLLKDARDAEVAGLDVLRQIVAQLASR